MNKETALKIAKAIVETIGGCILTPDNMLYRKVDDKWISKPSVQVKPNGHGFAMKWEEDITPEDVICNKQEIYGKKD